MYKFFGFMSVYAFFSSISYGQISGEAECNAHSQDYVTGQGSTTLPSYLSIDLKENESSVPKRIDKLGERFYVGKIYGTKDTDRYTLTIEAELSNGTFLPKGAASFYSDRKPHSLVIMDGTVLFYFTCRSL